jgi:hypothetical protein
MTTRKKLAVAALAGLFTASLFTANPSFAEEHDKSGCNGKDSANVEKASCKTAEGQEKHSCKGKNSCKGQGADGKNSCQGKGSCATDDSSAASE